MFHRRQSIALRFCILFLISIGTNSALAQTPGPLAGCIFTTEFTDPFLGVQGVSIPVSLDLGITQALTIGNTQGRVAQGGLADSSFNSNFPDGCSITAGRLIIAQAQQSIGTFSVTGPTVVTTLNGPFNRLEVGNVGRGFLNVSGGAFVDAASDPGNCPSGICNNFVGNIAGSRGELTIDGVGSRVEAINSFVVGVSAVFDVQDQGRDVTGIVNISNGGLLRTDNGTISGGPGGDIPDGTESTLGVMDIRGVGSEWIVAENVNIAGQPNATGDMFVCDGASATVGTTIEVGTGGTLLSNSTINGTVIVNGGTIGGGCSVGTMNVQGDLEFDTGEIVVEMEAASSFDIINVSGNATITEALVRFVFSNGYAPSAGDSIPFLQAPNLSGSQVITVETENILPGFEFDVSGGQLLAISDGVPATVSPQVDIRPGSESNKIYPRFGLIAVGVLTTEDEPMFDTAAIKDRSVRFGPRRTKAIGRRGIRIDLDYDGDRDVLYFFSARRSGISCGDTSAALTAKTKAGTQITATDTIETIGCH